MELHERIRQLLDHHGIRRAHFAGGGMGTSLLRLGAEAGDAVASAPAAAPTYRSIGASPTRGWPKSPSSPSSIPLPTSWSCDVKFKTVGEGVHAYMEWLDHNG